MDYNEYDMTKRKDKKKRTRVIVCSVIGVIIIGIAAGAFAVYGWQKNNITALRYVADYSADEIADRIEDSEQQTQERMSELAGIPLRPLTEEESRLLSDGEITQDDAVSLITGKKTLEEIQSERYPDAGENSQASESVSGGSGEYNGDGGNGGGNDGSGGGSQDVDISSTLAKIYALEGEFTSSVELLISQARSELGSMSTSDLMLKYAGMAASMEGECDSRLESLIGELESKLDASGGDKSIVGEIRDAYENKKSLKKAELISRFGN